MTRFFGVALALASVVCQGATAPGTKDVPSPPAPGNPSPDPSPKRGGENGSGRDARTTAAGRDARTTTAGTEAGATTAGATKPEALFEAFKPAGKIDELVLRRLKDENIPPSEKCSDEVFLRRVHMDVIGTLPTPTEVRSFLTSKATDKRSKLINDLLKRDEFAEYWGLKWGDLLRVKAEFPSNLWPNAVQAYDRWIRDSIRDNKPYDQFVRELLTGSGSNFRCPPVNFYRAFQERSPRQIADNVALLFMGLRLNDAGFNDEQILKFSAFFAKLGYKTTDEWKEEIVFFKPDGKLLDPKTKQPVQPEFLTAGRGLSMADRNPSPGPSPKRGGENDGRRDAGGTAAGGMPAIQADKDPRLALADWLTAPENPWFAKAMANRVWFWLNGRGIVHESDDMKSSNPPWSPELLTYLEKELVASKFDVKQLFKLILNSNTYQLSSWSNQWNTDDIMGFSHYHVRRLDAEPLLDAINQVTGSGEKYSSAIPEPFTFLPNDQRAICLADGSIESGFLEMFGRPPRNSSYESERGTTSSVFQAQHLLNSSHIQKKITQSKVLQQLATGSAKEGGDLNNLQKNVIEDLYVRILSRFPTTEERRVAHAYLTSPKRKAWESFCDVAWALMNSKEFGLKH
ncbi:MAG TPA: DUF1553 domain-containing protein [Planctomycetota bacterium]